VKVEVWYPGKFVERFLDRFFGRKRYGLYFQGRPVDICWKCGEYFFEDNAEYCEVCGTLKCNSGHCLCSLSPEARKAVEAELTSLGMWESTSPRRKKRRKK
jgi:hypothetical protein